MSNVAKLKKKAAEFEQKKQFDKALALYIQILEDSTGKDDEPEVSLYNRVGDLMLRQGTVGDAVTYYEKAVDLYAEGGFFNNAIALCNKILRHSPGRSSIYYKLGKISAKKGFNSDAKQNFLEYADRMQKAGQMDEAFRALKEFADLCPDQDDIRLMLADQLAKKERKGEALEQLQSLYEKYEGEGRSAEARATVDRMKAIDGTAEPKASQAPRQQKSADLVFLDVSWEDKNGGRDKSAPKAPAPPAAHVEPPAPPARRPTGSSPTVRPDESALLDSLPLLEAAPEPIGFPQDSDLGIEGSVTSGNSLGIEGTVSSGNALEGFETTSFGSESLAPPGGALESDLHTLSGQQFGELRLDTPSDSPLITSEHDLALPGELPLLDFADPSTSSAGGGLDLYMPDEQPAAAPARQDVFAELDPPIAGADENSLLEFDSASLTDSSGATDGLPMLDAGADSLSIETMSGDSYIADAGATDVQLGAGAGDSGLAGRDLQLVQPDDEAPTHAGGHLDLVMPDDEPAAQPAAAAAAHAPRRGSTSVLALSVDSLRDRVTAEPANWSLRQQLGEAMLEAGERDAALQELEAAMVGYERDGNLDSAGSVAEEIIRLNPVSVRHHQKRVEYAFRTNDRPRLTGAYLELADALFRSGQAAKSRTVYQRVLELAPDDVRAQAALAVVAEPDEPLTPPRKTVETRASATGVSRRYTAEVQRVTTPVNDREAARGGDEDFVNLGDWLRDDEGPKSTRMVVAEEAPSGDEQADFADMLRKFKQGVSENVDEEDHESHYDLGVAYKEMGLVDEAIAEFQKALRGPNQRVRTYEALGQCFLEKQQFQVASTILQRALAESGVSDEQLVGVLYLLGYASEALGHAADAVHFYQRVFAVDIQFRDVGDRLNSLERVAR